LNWAAVCPNPRFDAAVAGWLARILEVVASCRSSDYPVAAPVSSIIDEFDETDDINSIKK